MSVLEIKPGNYVRLTGTFLNENGGLANPTTVTLTVETSDGTHATPTPTSSATGIWTYDYLVADDCPDGEVWYRFKGTGAVVSADEGYFLVLKSRVLT